MTRCVSFLSISSALPPLPSTTTVTFNYRQWSCLRIPHPVITSTKRTRPLISSSISTNSTMNKINDNTCNIVHIESSTPPAKTTNSTLMHMGILLASIADKPAFAVSGSNNYEQDLTLVLIQSGAFAFFYFLIMPPIIMNWLRLSEKMNMVGRMTTILCVIVFAFTAVSGYLLFGDDTEPDILTNFDKNLGIKFSNGLNYIVRVGYVLHLILVFPVIHFSMRQAVGALVFREALLVGKKKVWGLTAILLLLIYLGSTLIPNIWVAFKFTGATTALSVGFIFPSLIALRLGNPSESPDFKLGETIISWVMLVFAILVSIVGVVGNVYSLRKSST